MIRVPSGQGHGGWRSFLSLVTPARTFFCLSDIVAMSKAPVITRRMETFLLTTEVWTSWQGAVDCVPEATSNRKLKQMPSDAVDWEYSFSRISQIQQSKPGELKEHENKSAITRRFTKPVGSTPFRYSYPPSQPAKQPLLAPTSPSAFVPHSILIYFRNGARCA